MIILFHQIYFLVELSIKMYEDFDELQKEKQKNMTKIKELQTQKDVLQGKIDELRKEEQNNGVKIEDLKKQLEKLLGDVDKLQKEKEGKDKQVKEKAKRIKMLQTTLGAKNKAIKKYQGKIKHYNETFNNFVKTIKTQEVATPSKEDVSITPESECHQND